MAKAITTSDPARADHRFVSYVNRFFCGGKLDLTPSLYASLLQAFREEGGSWYRLFRGSVDDVVLIKKIVKAQAKRQRDDEDGP